MDRRNFLKLLATGIAGYELDIDRLLWIPGERKIFIPSPIIHEADIVAMEMRRIIPHLHRVFEVSGTFYSTLKK